MIPDAPHSSFLRRRNALWQRLRQTEPGTPAFEEALAELSGLIGWDRARMLAGLGLNTLGLDEEAPEQEI